MAKTRHWTRPLDSADALGKAHNVAFPVSVIMPATGHVETQKPLAATLPMAIVASPIVPETSPEPTGGNVAPTGVTPLSQRSTIPLDQRERSNFAVVVAPKPLPLPPPPVPRPIPPVPIQSHLSIEAEDDVPLPPLPKIDQGTSVEEILLIVKERLDLLYGAVRK